MPANSLENWANFFITTAEVSATLAGLVIVAVSVNLPKIMAHRQLPPRASATVSIMMLAVIVGLAALVPQPVKAFAVEVFAAAVFCWIIQLACTREIVVEHFKAGRPNFELAVGLPGGHTALLAFVIGSAVLWTGNANGLYWIAGALGVALIYAVLNAWVFLIEVLR